MRVQRRMALPLALALGALGLMVVAQIAGATHARPKGATPVLVSTVIAYKQCTTGTNRQHGPPLAALSCNPPVQTSAVATVGTGDAWPGTVPQNSGTIRLDVKATHRRDPADPNQRRRYRRRCAHNRRQHAVRDPGDLDSVVAKG